MLVGMTLPVTVAIVLGLGTTALAGLSESKEELCISLDPVVLIGGFQQQVIGLPANSYACNQPADGKCAVVTDGSGKFPSMEACVADPSCQAPPPPPPPTFNCDQPADGKCTAVTDGSGKFPSMDACTKDPSCAAPMYSCNSPPNGDCKLDPKGAFPSMEQCKDEHSCAEPYPPPPPCKNPCKWSGKQTDFNFDQTSNQHISTVADTEAECAVRCCHRGSGCSGYAYHQVTNGSNCQLWLGVLPATVAASGWFIGINGPPETHCDPPTFGCNSPPDGQCKTHTDGKGAFVTEAACIAAPSCKKPAPPSTVLPGAPSAVPRRQLQGRGAPYALNWAPQHEAGVSGRCQPASNVTAYHGATLYEKLTCVGETSVTFEYYSDSDCRHAITWPAFFADVMGIPPGLLVSVGFAGKLSSSSWTPVISIHHAGQDPESFEIKLSGVQGCGCPSLSTGQKTALGLGMFTLLLLGGIGGACVARKYCRRATQFDPKFDGFKESLQSTHGDHLADPRMSGFTVGPRTMLSGRRSDSGR